MSEQMRKALEARIKETQERLQITQEAIAKAEADMKAASVTVKSRCRSVEVTVGSQGELIGVKFPGVKFQAMDAKSLAAAVLEASDKARMQMARMVMETFNPVQEIARDTMPEARDVSFDWQGVFGELFTRIQEQDNKKGGRRG